MALLEIGLVVALGFAAASLVFRTGSATLRVVTAVALGVALLAGLVRGTPAGPPHPVRIDRDRARATGSGACQPCHPSEFASWHRSFHRTMTQAATPATVLGPWDGTKLEVEGRSLELSRRGDELWARLPDPDLVASAIRAKNPAPYAAAPLVLRRVVLTTGSHHHQVYWVGGERGNELRLLPITYLIAEGRYVPRRDAFLQPPDAAPHAVRWNSNCISCHATRGRPELDETRDVFASEAVELGIACEACHGPGAEHIARHRNPLARLVTHLASAPDLSIVNPERLAPERASDVCGQCHAYFVPRDEDRFWRAGLSDFTPGDALERTRVLLAPADARDTAHEPRAPLVEAAAESLFWADGTIRVGGRELNGLERSACFLRGHGEKRISCLSCHSLHASDPDDQLRRDESIDAACTHCHEPIRARLAEHTHHAAGSPGSSCIACHMPYTSYALFTAIRSHRIDSPSALATAAGKRPNACNLCHLDRSLQWTAETLERWYGRDPATSGAARDTATAAALADETPRALVELLAGDAATRAVLASAFGRAEARAAAGATWEARALAELLDDPYAAVRKVACDSLRRTPGFGDFFCDFTAAPEARRAARRAAVERFARLHAERSRVFIGDDTDALDARIDALLRMRDDRPTTISE